MVRRLGILLLGAVAVATAARAAWPKSSVPLIHGSADQGDVIVTLILLASLPMLTRRCSGAPDNRPARRVRAGCYAAILAIMPAWAVTDMFIGAAPHGGIDLHTFDALYDNGPLPAPGSVTESAWVRDWLYHGQHLTASALYGRELYASGGMAFYAVVCVIFPIVGLIMGLAGSGYANVARAGGPAEAGALATLKGG